MSGRTHMQYDSNPVNLIKWVQLDKNYLHFHKKYTMDTLAKFSVFSAIAWSISMVKQQTEMEGLFHIYGEMYIFRNYTCHPLKYKMGNFRLILVST